jgi:hypothetical protein
VKSFLGMPVLARDFRLKGRGREVISRFDKTSADRKQNWNKGDKQYEDASNAGVVA